MSGLFASAARLAVLRVFLLDPMREYYQRQLSVATGLPIRAIQRELERLAAVGLLYRREEGNRAYYLVDREFPLYPELRGMVLKTVGPAARLRGLASVDEAVWLAFLAQGGARALIVLHPGKTAHADWPAEIEVEMMDGAAFTEALAARTPELDKFLAHGTDLLGRRDDVIWRRIEAAGYTVPKGDGIP